LSPEAATKKLEQLNVKTIQMIQKHNLTGLDKLKCENRFAFEKFQLMIDSGIISKKGWWPET